MSLFKCEQLEADIRLFYHAAIVHSLNPSTNIVLDVADTDVLVLASYVSCKKDLPLYLHKNGKLYDCQKLGPKAQSAMLPALHCITGCDTVSGCFGHSKKAIFDCGMRNMKLFESLKDLGSSLELSPRLIASLKVFIIRLVYNDITSSSSQQAIKKKWSAQKNKSLERLPPDPETFKYHCLRANLQCYMMKSYDSEGGSPSPLTHGWKKGYDGTIQPIMYIHRKSRV